MRPINKGPWPLNRWGTRPLVFNDWTRAIPHLRLNSGSYCHFCEMKVTNALSIEHIKPRVHYPGLSNHWDNFLLICNYCNSEKLDTIPKNYKQNYFWPHLNNTLLIFDCDFTTGLIIPNSALVNQVYIDRALALIDLYGLDKHKNANGSCDARWLERISAMYLAVKRRLEYSNGAATIDSIVEFALTTGFFTVWLKVFNNIPQVYAALIQCIDFKIPIADCFNGALLPVPRNALDL